MLHILAEQDPGELVEGLTGRRPRHRLRRRRHRPRHRHRHRGRQRHHRHGPPARGRRHGPHHHVPRHRLHRGARPLRLRPRLHHLGLRRPPMRIRRAACAAPLRRRWLGAPRRPRARRSATRQERRGRARGRARRDDGRGVHPSSSRRATTVDDCQEAPSPILPATNELIWGAHLASLIAARPAVEVRLARHQEGHGGPHRADPRRPRRGRAGQGRGRGACSTDYQAPAGRRQDRGRPHHRGGPSGRPTR